MAGEFHCFRRLPGYTNPTTNVSAGLTRPSQFVTDFLFMTKADLVVRPKTIFFCERDRFALPKTNEVLTNGFQ